MPPGREIVSTHPLSRRTAIIDAAGQSLWLYLSQPGTITPNNDCWLANLPGPFTEEELAALRGKGLPPPAPSNILDRAADDLPADPECYRLEWSSDGEAVQAVAGDRPIAFIMAGEKRGFHASLLVDCPWGHRFDHDQHCELFGR